MYRIAIASVCLWAFSVGCGGDSSPTTTPAPAPLAPAPAPPPPAPVPPGVPSGLHVSASGETFIEWTWSAVEGANGYDAQFSTNEAFTDADEVIARAEGELSYRREGLAASTSAYLRVRAASGTGDGRITSEWSDHAAGMTAAPPTPPPTTERTSFGAGTWLVGSDIEPGRYFTNPRDGCYWERLSGLGGTSADRIANEFIGFDSPQEIVDIAPSDRAFNTDEDCGTWDQTPEPPPPAGTIPPGTWLVGGQVAPGVYEVEAGDGCYWERLSGFSGRTSEDVLANDFVSGGGRQLVEIAASDVGFSNDEDCGTWRAIDSATVGLLGGATASETMEANRQLHEAHRDRHRH